MVKKLSESILDKFSIDFLRNQVLKNAYGNDDTVIAKLDPRILFVWYLFFALVPWFSGNVIFPAGMFRDCYSDHTDGKSCRIGYRIVCTWRIFTDRIFIYSFSAVWRRCIDCTSPPYPDTESSYSFSGIDHRIFRVGSGQAFQRADVVRMSGKIIVFYFICLPDAADADGGISECTVILPPQRQCA